MRFLLPATFNYSFMNRMISLIGKLAFVMCIIFICGCSPKEKEPIDTSFLDEENYGYDISGRDAISSRSIEHILIDTDRQVITTLTVHYQRHSTKIDTIRVDESYYYETTNDGGMKILSTLNDYTYYVVDKENNRYIEKRYSSGELNQSFLVQDTRTAIPYLFAGLGKPDNKEVLAKHLTPDQ